MPTFRAAVLLLTVLLTACQRLDVRPPVPVPSPWRELGSPVLDGDPPRVQHSAVWTGNELLVWGGHTMIVGNCPHGPWADGARLDPAAGEWERLAAAPLEVRARHFAFWTGSEMLVVGGQAFGCTSAPALDGAAYDPAADAWRTLPPLPAPFPALPPETTWADLRPGGPAGLPDGLPGGIDTAAWTGTELLVWSGAYGGAAYDPRADRWRAIAPAPLGVPAEVATSTWTGSRWLVWSGAAGAGYDPVADAWQPLGAAFVPRRDDVLAWAGEIGRVLAYRSDDDSLHAYDVAGDTWEELPESPLRAAAEESIYEGLHSEGVQGVWTGDRLVLWGGTRPPEMLAGIDASDLPPPGPETFAYDPATRTWSELAASPLGRRQDGTVTWTGREMIVVGGFDVAVGASGQAFDPAGPNAPAAAYRIERG